MKKNIFIFKVIDNELSKILHKYFEKVQIDTLTGNITFYKAVTMNMVIAECYRFIESKSIADELIYNNMKIIRKGLMENTLIGEMALFGGLTEVALSVYTVNKHTGNYEKFLEKINMLLTSKLLSKMDNLNKKIQSLEEVDYDVISGLSGVTSYLLLLGRYEEITKRALELLVHICSYKNINGNVIPNWHIHQKNLDIENRTNYPNGYINLGLAHGIAGPLVILSKAYKNGIIVKGQKEAILNIINLYNKYSIRSEGYTYWPMILSFEEYLSEVKEKTNVRDGWCYGGIGIARAIFIASNALMDNKMQEWAYKIIEERAKMGIEEYNLISPTLCHGYAGVLSILANTIREKEESLLIKQRIDHIRKKIISMFDEASKYGFIDVELRMDDGKYILDKQDTYLFISGASGIILALLSLYHESTSLDTHLLI
ncbi:lanthionine synthetase C family protein [Bacillus sp. K2I17]|uniref:lanthionine synthetase C family protein n=1 Tax=Bacillus sp. K2I17 TaxID=2014743 RepID=UPI000B514C68|nr:lanthionine synthetase C family protein [Bacillus sp. K2I17]OWT47261.1 hypothetical protein CER22_32185 [Bacillus sp. K2I17]